MRTAFSPSATSHAGDFVGTSLRTGIRLRLGRRCRLLFPTLRLDEIRLAKAEFRFFRVRRETSTTGICPLFWRVIEPDFGALRPKLAEASFNGLFAVNIMVTLLVENNIFFLYKGAVGAKRCEQVWDKGSKVSLEDPRPE